MVVMIVGLEKVLMWPDRWCLIGFVGFPSVRKSIVLNNLAGVFWSEPINSPLWPPSLVSSDIKVSRYQWRCHGPAHGSPGCHWRCQWWKRQMSSCLCRVQTCHLIWIILDVLKHLGHKKITGNESEGFGIRSISKCPEVDLKKKDKGGIHLSAPVSGKAMWGSLLIKGTGVKSGFKCVETDHLESFWLFYLYWDHLVTLQWVLYKTRVAGLTLRLTFFYFFFLVLCLGCCGYLINYYHEVAANILCFYLLNMN